MSNKKKGILFIILAIILFAGTILNYNNKNAVANELNDNYIDIASDIIDSKNNGKLVALSGKLEYDNEVLKDSDFNVNASSPVLKRNVEVFVWIEEEQVENGQTSYVYSKKWMDELVDSKKFHFQERYENPTKLDYESKTITAKNIKVGAFNLSKNEIKSLRTTKKLDLTNISKKKLPKGYKVIDNYLTNSKNIESPEVGDIRITYTYNNDQEVSILAQQKDNNLTYYKTKNGKLVDILLSGKESGNKIIEAFKKDTSVLNTFLIIISLCIFIVGYIYIAKEK